MGRRAASRNRGGHEGSSGSEVVGDPTSEAEKPPLCLPTGDGCETDAPAHPLPREAFSFLDDGNYPELDSGDGCTTF